MAGFRIAHINPDPTPKRKSMKKADYLSFIRKLPCAITGRYGVEAAHLSYAFPMFGHYGRGKGSKASDRWALPLCPEEHRIQHSHDEMTYWSTATSRDPHVLALTLWGLWSEMGDDAEPFAAAIINKGIYRDTQYSADRGIARSE